MKRMAALTLALLLLGSGFGCLEDIEEVPLDPGIDEIQAPRGLAAQVDDGLIILTWRRAAGASAYRLYRAESEEERPDRLAATVDTFYVDADVRNGQEYYYSVSAVAASGIEGDRSEKIAAVPTAYSIIINGGDEYTGSRTVNLQLSAPITTVLMMIANESGFTNGVWEVYRFNRSWNIPAGDGAKTVYARFRDENGSESPAMSDEIHLDTYAAISGVTVTPEPETHLYVPGEAVHFTVNVEDDEPAGQSWIELEGYEGQIRLTDDGRGGDDTAADGVYESDFTFPKTVRGKDLAVFGSFIDRAGNRAPLFEADYTLSFTDPPDPVQLIGVRDSTVGSITIQWVASTEEHFSRYAIYRDTEQEGINKDDPDPALLVQELYNIGQTAYPDGGLIEGETYYYRIFVVNDLDESAGSNPLTAHTHDAYPNPVVLDPLSAIGSDRVTLTWSENTNTDFREYRIYRSTSPGVDTLTPPVETITDRERTYYDDTGLNLSSFTYYYRVYVFDKGGKSSRSNEVATDG